MPTFQNTINAVKTPQDCFNQRIALIKEIEKITNRRLLVYIADIRKPEGMLSPEDKTGFSDLIEDVKEEEVDLLINSPGGFAEVAEVIVNMLRARFKSVRFAIPNMAKSAATLLVLSGDELIMDARSELGPIDPQVEYPSIDGRKREAAEDILEGFKEAKEILASEGPAATPAFVPLLSKYTVGLLRGCKNAMQLSKELAEKWLRKYMFGDAPESTIPKGVVDYFAVRSNSLSHNRAILVDKCIELGIKVLDSKKEENSCIINNLWKLWCLYEVHLEKAPVVYKLYENSSGCSLQKQTIQLQVVAGPKPPGMPPFPQPSPPK
jgi:hypothetical protein